VSEPTVRRSGLRWRPDPEPAAQMAPQPPVEEGPPRLFEVATSEPSRASRRRTATAPRPTSQVEDPDAAMRQRLAAAITAAAELERLVTEVPVLRSLPGLARALVAEVQQAFAADTVGFWQLAEEGYGAVAAVGFTSLEARRLVDRDQPMMSEVDDSGGGLLIDPVEAAQAAVAGIGGAHTESFMAASVAAGPGRFGIITVGRNEPLTPGDLDRLMALTKEAAPGVAAAELLARLGRLAASEPVHGGADPGAPTAD
jgi:hypothetical protein